jgi:hypothetical protein
VPATGPAREPSAELLADTVRDPEARAHV